MRLLPVIVAIAVSTILGPNAFARQSRPASSQIGNGTVFQLARKHPNWFREPKTYKPCPSDVELPNGRLACLGGEG